MTYSLHENESQITLSVNMVLWEYFIREAFFCPVFQQFWVKILCNGLVFKWVSAVCDNTKEPEESILLYEVC